MSYHWLRQGFERSRFCSGKHKEIIAKSHPNQPDGCKCKLGFLKYRKKRSTSLHCDIVMSAFSVLKKSVLSKQNHEILGDTTEAGSEKVQLHVHKV